jgi:hypothetical protein
MPKKLPQFFSAIINNLLGKHGRPVYGFILPGYFFANLPKNPAIAGAQERRNG